MQEITLTELEDQRQYGLYLLDVRSPQEREAFPFSVDGYSSLGDIQDNEGVTGLAFDTAICVLCERGHLSELAVLYLEVFGYTQVFHLAKGLQAYRQP